MLQLVTDTSACVLEVRGLNHRLEIHLPGWGLLSFHRVEVCRIFSSSYVNWWNI